MSETPNLEYQNNDVWRHRLITALRSYYERWPQEEQTIQRFVEFVSTEPGCFHRSTEHGHLTGAAWLVDPPGERVLLTHHRKLDKWLQLGGHADGQGNILEVALTEAREESGIHEVHPISMEIFDIDVHDIPARKKDPEHLHYDVRFLMRSARTDYVVGDESHDLEWVPITQIDAVTTEPSMLRMAHKWLTMNK